MSLQVKINSTLDLPGEIHALFGKAIEEWDRVGGRRLLRSTTNHPDRPIPVPFRHFRRPYRDTAGLTVNIGLFVHIL